MDRLHFLTAASLLLPLSAICAADPPEDRARVAAVQDFPDWQKRPLTAPQLAQCLRNLQSGDRDTQRAALEQLALARPTPDRRDQVYNAAAPVAKQHDDYFAKGMLAQINACWSEARQAALLLQQARRNGGLRYIRRVLEQGNPVEKVQALSALGYSNEPATAAPLLVDHFELNNGVAGRALAILGPPAAPETLRLLQHAEWPVRKNACEVLAKIGTPAEIPALQELDRDLNPLVKSEARQTIETIRARAAAPTLND
jgi:hypothetical protein